VAEITYKYTAKLYEMYFLFLMILEYFRWFNRKPALWIPTCPFIEYQTLGEKNSYGTDFKKCLHPSIVVLVVVVFVVVAAAGAV